MDDFEEIEKANLEDVIKEFEGWAEGYVHGAKLSETPYMFVKVLGCLYDFQKHLRETTQQQKETE